MVKKGSSPDSGEGGSDFKEEVVIIPEAVGSAFNHLDGVVDAFEKAGVEPPSAMSDDARVNVKDFSHPRGKDISHRHGKDISHPPRE